MGVMCKKLLSGEKGVSAVQRVVAKPLVFEFYSDSQLVGKKLKHEVSRILTSPTEFSFHMVRRAVWIRVRITQALTIYCNVRCLPDRVFSRKAHHSRKIYLEQQHLTGEASFWLDVHREAGTGLTVAPMTLPR